MLYSQYFEKVFACGFITLFLYALYLYDLFRILLLPLQTYGAMECVCVCVISQK